MPPRPTRSLKHEYELFVEREIEHYKESLPRHVLLGLGDEAAASLAAQQQLVLTEVLLCEEVDKIIFRRLKLPAYSTWRRRRVKQLEELRRPERWGLAPDDVLVREARAVGEGHVLVAGPHADTPALYLAAHGADVTAVTDELDEVQRVLDAADALGLVDRVHPLPGGLGSWEPDAMLKAVVCTASAFARLSPLERTRAIELLQLATSNGGVHVVRTAPADPALPSLDELRGRYDGWQISIEGSGTGPASFIARKSIPS